MNEKDENSFNEEDIPLVMIGSYEWAKNTGVFNGTLEDFVKLQYMAYRLLCEKYDTSPYSLRAWVSAYGKKHFKYNKGEQ